MALKNKLKNWGIHFNIPKLKFEIEELDKETIKADFWDDLENSQKILQLLKNKKSKLQRKIFFRKRKYFLFWFFVKLTKVNLFFRRRKNRSDIERFLNLAEKDLGNFC